MAYVRFIISDSSKKIICIAANKILTSKDVVVVGMIVHIKTSMINKIDLQ